MTREHTLPTGLLAWLAGLLLIGSTLVPSSAANAQEAEQLAARGRGLLLDGHLEDANKTFMEAWQKYQGSGQWDGKFQFYLGLTQQEISKQQPEDQRKAALEESRKWYQAALKLIPESGATINNLAQVELALGQPQRAAELLEQAVELADDRQPFYTANYAEALAAAGNWKDAARFYRLAAFAKPPSDKARQALVGLYLEHQPQQLHLYLRELLDEGAITAAEDGALQALLRGRLEPRTSAELLGVVVACLSERQIDPQTFPRSEQAAKLKQLAAEHDYLGPCVTEIFNLYRGDVKPERYNWWSSQHERLGLSRTNAWPEDDFRSLIRSIGNWYRQRKALDRAQAYYELAINLVRGYPDPETFLDLADLHLATGRKEQLAQMTEKYEETLFAGKNEAYRQRQWDKIYDYHRALGVVYTELGRFEGGVASATFQLEHALTAANQWNESAAPGTPRTPIQVEPRVINLLADVYEKQDRPDKASTIRLDNAEKFLEAGDIRASQELIEAIEKSGPNNLRTPDKTRFEHLKVEMQKTAPGSTRSATPPRNEAILVEPQGGTRPVGKPPASVILRPTHDTLPSQQIERIGTSVSGLVERAQTAPRASTGFQLFPDKSIPPEVLEVKSRGTKGTVVVEQKSKQIEVPFEVETTPNKPRLRPFHFVKPSAKPQ